ncbi:hypothetical protein [Spirosoma pollinicola]|nr:hypothetical protein [Spirosoma pollinicola]
MKKIAMSVIGGSLFVAGYYHVHRHSAIVDTKDAQLSIQKPVSTIPFKTLPAFAFRSGKYFTF